jgi:hypothetical protein
MPEILLMILSLKQVIMGIIIIRVLLHPEGKTSWQNLTGFL